MSKEKNNSKLVIYGVFFLLAVVAVYISISNIFVKKEIGLKNETQDKNISSLTLYGNNSFGQLGKPSYELNSNVNRLEFSDDVAQMASGRNYTVLLFKNGKVKSWGGNEWGQLGYETVGSYYNPTPKDIEVEDIVKVDTKNNHTLLLKKDGTVLSFGSNFSGQLGSGDNKDSFKPEVVKGLENIKDIAAGYKFSIVLKEDGSVWGFGASCDKSTKAEADKWWKSITSGMSRIDGGYYDATSDSLVQYDKSEYCVNEDIVGILSKVPVKVKNLENITALSVGYGHGLALDSEGSVWSFGCNTFQQLGRITQKKEDNQGAQKIEGLPKIKTVYAGYRHSLAIAEDGSVWGFGLNNHGQLGLKTAEDLVSVPVKIPIDNVTMIVAAFDYSLALKKDGTVWGFGINRDRFLNDSESEFVFDPIKLKNFDKVSFLSASGQNVTALTD